MNTCPDCGKHRFYVELLIVGTLLADLDNEVDYDIAEGAVLEPNGDEAHTVCMDSTCGWEGPLSATNPP